MVVDIDGVVSDARHRQHHLVGSRKRWEDFFDACEGDGLIVSTAALLDHLEATLSVLLLTGRPISIQTKTEDWLRRHSLRWDILMMRDFGDYSQALVFKERELKRIVEMGTKVVLAIEDDPRNVAMFSRHEIPVLYIHSGYYE